MSIKKTQAILECFIDLKCGVWFTLGSADETTFCDTKNYSPQIWHPDVSTWHEQNLRVPRKDHRNNAPDFTALKRLVENLINADNLAKSVSVHNLSAITSLEKPTVIKPCGQILIAATRHIIFCITGSISEKLVILTAREMCAKLRSI